MKSVLVLEATTMNVSVEIGSSVGSRPVQDFGTVSVSSASVIGQSVGGLWNAALWMNVWLLGKS